MFLPLVFLSFACTGGDDTDPPVPTVPTVDTDDTDVPLPTGHTGVEDFVVDCTNLPTGPFTGRRLDDPRAYHGIAFDAFGGMVGSDNTNLLMSTATDDTSIFVPNMGQMQQMDYLPDGDLVVAKADTGNIVRIAPDGTRTTLASNIYAYGVDVGPDGMIYTANQTVMHRIDPNGGGAEVFIPQGAISTPKVSNFSPDGSKLYVGTNGSGNIWVVDIDSDGEPVLPATLLASTPGTWHDGLGIDACGNLYVNEYTNGNLHRITPDGDVILLVNFTAINFNFYGHGIAWGSGVGNWDDEKIYVPLPYDGNKVAEIDLGIPSKDWNGGDYTIIE